MKNELFNTGWEFCKKPLGTSLTAVCRDNSFTPVELPHDWLIYNSLDLYETAEGWYRKRFSCPVAEGETAFLRFEGIYMDSTVYLNGRKAFEWKYGYSSFEFELTPYLSSASYIRARIPAGIPAQESTAMSGLKSGPPGIFIRTASTPQYAGAGTAGRLLRTAL